METANPELQQYMTKLKPNIIIEGDFFNEPVEIILVQEIGDSLKIIGRGINTGQTHDPIFDVNQLSMLKISSDTLPFDGDPNRFRLGVEALRLGFAYEYDPYFSLSIARVDPLPHQLEAVYDYFLKSPRIRFLLADDPGAGKTIMAGLLLKELKIRGLVNRTLIISPANLTFQWQRELRDKFRERFKVIRGDSLRADYHINPFIDNKQVITSVSWVSRIEDAKESLERSNWDLVIVDEAHKMSAYSHEKKTLAYQLGETISSRTDHFLMMTATPHKGDPENFCLFLELLDKDVYGDVSSLEEAMRRNNAPFYLRRTKETLVKFPDPETGIIEKLFTKRDVQTVEFRIDDEEWDFYDSLTRYVENQSIKAQADSSIRGRALAFTMAMLQRRFASSIYAVRRSLERMKDKRERILEDPEGYREEQIAKKIPDDYDDLPEDEQHTLMLELEQVVASVDPAALREEIIELSRLIDSAKHLETREIESKLRKLKEVIHEQGIFEDKKMKLLIFTEHKDTLDYLVGRLEEWGLDVTQIHGGMKIGDRDKEGTRIHAERAFRDESQILVATEAAGEGINLQFCWFMINYDIPWNPVRLEQRMGRIHRYGQENDCLILNFVSTNTREGRVLQKLLDRLREIRKELGTDSVFDVIGSVFPSNALEKMVRDMYAHQTKEEDIKTEIDINIDPEKFRAITESALEGLAKKDLNLSALIGKKAEAKERRLVPEVIEDFFVQSSPLLGIAPKELKALPHIYRVGRIPRGLWPIGERLEDRFGVLGHNYKQIVFDKSLIEKDVTSEWVTPGHPLFEVVREALLKIALNDFKKGSMFYDLHTKEPYLLDIFTASIKDGQGNYILRKVFVVKTESDGNRTVKQPTIFLDLSLGHEGTSVPTNLEMPSRDLAERTLLEKQLKPLLNELIKDRIKENDIVAKHVEISLNAIIDRIQCQYAELSEQKTGGSNEPGLDGRIKMTEDRLEELNGRLERRRDELARERQCSISDIQHIGRAVVLPHPERSSPGVAPMVRDDDIEKIAVDEVIKYEEERGWFVESVEKDNRGFDLISRKPHPEDPQTAIDVKFIEVKGRAKVGEVGLTTNEYKTAERLKDEYWLYVVYNCASNPEVIAINNPVRLGWEPIVTIEHYHVGSEEILGERS